MKGFDYIETLSGGADQWQNSSWKIKTAVSGMNGELAEILDAAEADGVRNLEEILKEDAYVDANKKNCVKASRELLILLARYKSSEASTIVRSVTGLQGVEAWSTLHVN